MSGAWNNWFRVTIHTYGSWLPGDPRGHRTRHHHDRVGGDYKRRPENRPERRAHHAFAQELMQRSPVRLTRAERLVVCAELTASLRRHRVLVAICSVDANHADVLAKFSDEMSDALVARVARLSESRNAGLAPVRHLIGIAKKDAARARRDRGHTETGGVWAKRSRCQPVRDRAHQVAAFRYIGRHEREGAFVVQVRDRDRKDERNASF